MRIILPLSILCLLVSSCSLSGSEPRTTEFSECEECPIMVSLPAGSFLMGTAVEDRLIDPRTGKPATNDGPQHEVIITTPFAMGKYEVTVAQFRAFINATGYETVDRCMEFSKKDSFAIRTDIDWDNPGFEQSKNSPVGCVSFFDAEAYANWLSSVTGEPYRLPTEAEWEYAARAGSVSAYFWGDDSRKSCEYANVRSEGAPSISKRQAESDQNDGFPCDDGATQSSPVGDYEPNEFGLYDMQGNAWEWVADCNHKNYQDAPSDGSAWLDSKDCRFGVIRGGSYLNRVERSSTTVRAGRPRSGAATNMGFRIARGSKPSQATMAAAPAPVVFEARADISEGAVLFADNCAACHQTPTGFQGLYGKDRKSLIKVVRDGGNNIMSMPAFADRLDDRQIGEIVDYLRRTNKWD